MATKKTKLDIELTCDRGLHWVRTDWPQYDILIDIDCAVAILTIVAHQFIDIQDEQEQTAFEKELMKRFKVEMLERFDNIEPIDDEH